MPPRTPARAQPEPGTSLSTNVMSDAEREALLRAQGQQVTTFQRLPMINIMGAGAGLFEFTDTQETAREFNAIILNSHPRNVLWDRPYGAPAPEGEEGPACGSPDGIVGTPRNGFAHKALRVVSNGTENIPCAECPYNKWGSKALIDPTARNTKGKGCTNQKSVFVLVEGREVPMEIILPPTSIKTFDAYLANLTNHAILALGVVTKFKQKIEVSGTLRWAVAQFERGETLADELLLQVVDKRRRYLRQISPESANIPAAPAAAAPVSYDSHEEVGDGPVPF